MMFYPYDPNPEHPPDVARFLHREASGDSPLLPDPDVAVAQRRLDPQIETMQSSLVERIAAVDDERRRNAKQMHRALESQRGEVAALASRQRMGLVLVAALMILLTVLSIGFVLFQVGRMQRDWHADLELLQQQVATTKAGAPVTTGHGAVAEQQSAGSTSSAAVAGAVETTSLDSLTQGLEGQIAVLRERLARLMVDVTEIESNGSADATAGSTDATTSAPPLVQVAGERSAVILPKHGMLVQTPVDAEPSAAVDRTLAPPEPAVAEPAPAAPELTTREASVLELKTPELAASESAASEPAAPDAGRAAGSGPEAIRSVAPAVDEAEAGPAATGSAAQLNGSALAKASPPKAADASDARAAAMADMQSDETIDSRSVDELVDALIERRLGEVDRDYQRLARELSAPAVRPRRAVENELSDAEDEAILDTVDGGSAGISGISGRLTAVSSPERIAITNRPFALQLIGFHSRELLDGFVERSPLPNRVYMREERFRGRPWFVLIHSLHQDRAAAQQASEALPDALGRLDLWIRELSAETELDVIDRSGDQTSTLVGP